MKTRIKIKMEQILWLNLQTQLKITKEWKNILKIYFHNKLQKNKNQISVICHSSYFFICNWKYPSMPVHRVDSEQMDASVLGTQCYRTRVNMDWGKFVENPRCCRACIQSEWICWINWSLTTDVPLTARKWRQYVAVLF